MDSLSQVVTELARQLQELVPPQPGSRRKRSSHRKKLEQLQLGDQKVLDYLGSVQADLLGLSRVLPPKRPELEK